LELGNNKKINKSNQKMSLQSQVDQKQILVDQWKKKKLHISTLQNQLKKKTKKLAKSDKTKLSNF